MPDIQFSSNWNKQVDISYSKTPKLVQNHESGLNEEDMRAVVLKILDIEGMRAPPPSMHQRFKDLSARLLSSNGVVSVVKGIHQRDTDVHITINIPPMGQHDAGFEVFLRAQDRPNSNSSGSPGIQFDYVPVGITTKTSGLLQKWPAGFVYTKRDDHGGIGRTRGSSFSVGNSAPPKILENVK